jgi:hypothetical protein
MPQAPTQQQGVQNLDIPLVVDGDDNFIIGSDSYVRADKLYPGEYPTSMNCINRGGMIQTRPGSVSLFNLPAGNLQGLTFWAPSGSTTTYLVACVSGLIYVSPSPYSTYTNLPSIQFNPNSKYIAWASALQSTDYDESGTLYTLQTPVSCLMMQDGNTRAAYWNGTTSGHLNPTPTPRNPITADIIAASNSIPITLTLAQPIIIGNGESVTVNGVQGNFGANGTWSVTTIDSTHLSLNGSVGTGNYTQSGAPVSTTIIGASNTSPIVLTFSTPLFLATGQIVTVSNVQGNTNANGTWAIEYIDPYQVALAGTVGNGTFVSITPNTVASTTPLPTLTATPVATLTTNPTSTGEVATIPGYDGTPVGLWMVWSNNRLWVSNGTYVYASDIGNPLKFTEDQYLAEAPYFLLPNVCTGAIESPDKSGVIFFTKDVGILLLSSIQDRTTWQSTPGFQTTVCPNLGCAAPRSLVQQYGLIWWYTAKGLISQNAALVANITSRMDVTDNEMIQSKSGLSHDISMICGGTYENYLFHAVPHESSINNRLHVLDQAPWEGKMDFWKLNSWPGYWTGWRPVEFAHGYNGSTERVFLASQDYDGVNRVWEIFRDEKTDNGMPITSFVVTKTHYYGNRDYKNFRYAEVELVGVAGPTAVMVAVAGVRGAYQVELVKDLNAQQGQVYATQLYGANAGNFAGTSMQTRVIRTVDNPPPSPQNNNSVESKLFTGLKDKAFSLLICWSGIAGVQAYRIFAQNEPYPMMGYPEENETDQLHLLNAEGVGTDLSLFETTSSWPKFYETVTFSKLNPTTGLPVTSQITCSSIISQIDAQRRATAMAQWYVLTQIGEII